MQPAGRVFLAWLIVVLAGCGSDHRIHEYNFLALGTLVKVSIYGDDEEAAADVVRLLETDFAWLHDNFYPTRGELGALNEALTAGTSTTVGPDLQVLLKRGQELEQQSDGLFNPALGELFFLWGFVNDERPAYLPPPDAESIADILKQQPSMQKLTIDRNEVSSTTPLLLDLGGYAKGYALEVGTQRLLNAGVENALINAGGDITALGQAGERPWRIGIRDPDGSSVLAGIEMRDRETVVTSGDYERFFEHGGIRFHHILDPRSGYPAARTRSVTVIDTDAVLADAAATALFVAGPGEWINVASSMGVRYVMLVDDDQQIHMTRDMADRIELTGEDYQLKVIDLP